MEENLREFLDVCARRNNFRIEDAFKNEQQVSGQFWAMAQNEYCNDNLGIMLEVHRQATEGRSDIDIAKFGVSDSSMEETCVLRHFGNYCALAHASAEMFCEAMQRYTFAGLQEIMRQFVECEAQGKVERVNIPLEHTLFRNADTRNITDTQQSGVDASASAHKAFSELEYAIMLLQEPMSATRKRCVNLPWLATVQIFKNFV